MVKWFCLQEIEARTELKTLQGSEVILFMHVTIYYLLFISSLNYDMYLPLRHCWFYPPIYEAL